MSGPSGEVTVLLSQLREGHREAADQLMPLVYAELRRMAAGYMRRERVGHTLQATALVSEAYMRLLGGDAPVVENRAHFFAIAAHVMRQVLRDYARGRGAQKRGGPEARKVDIDAELLMDHNGLEDVIAIDEALDRLAKIDERQSRLIELRFFGGLSVEEAAEVMNLAPVTLKRDWRIAKAWLHNELTNAKSE